MRDDETFCGSIGAHSSAAPHPEIPPPGIADEANQLNDLFVRLVEHGQHVLIERSRCFMAVLSVFIVWLISRYSTCVVSGRARRTLWIAVP
jgi:hypothetical protein